MASPYEPLVYCALFNIMLCCGQGRYIDEIPKHLAGHHKSIPLVQRQKIHAAAARIPGIISSRSEVNALKFPTAPIPPVVGLAAPRKDGLRCGSCAYICCTVIGIQAHCRTKHSWINPRRRGRARPIVSAAADPWTAGVSCQRLFTSGERHLWFEVTYSKTYADPAAEQAGSDPNLQALTLRMTEQSHRLDQYRLAPPPLLVAAKQEPNSWLARVGWDRHLIASTTDPATLLLTTKPPEESEIDIAVIYRSIRRMLDRAFHTVDSMDRNHAALFEVMRSDPSKPSRRPFRIDMEVHTWHKYTAIFAGILLYAIRTWDWEPPIRPPYTLTKEQTSTLSDIFAIVSRIRTASDPTEGLFVTEELDWALARLSVSMFDHVLRSNDGQYESVLISALAVLAVKEDGDWIQPENFTSVYSAVLKIGRMVVVHHAVGQHVEAKEAEDRGSGVESEDEEDIIRRIPSTYELVHASTQRFLAKCGPQFRPTPFSCMLEARAYAMTIAKEKTVPGEIEWSGDTVSLRKIRFTISSLQDMVLGLIQEAGDLIATLILMPAVPQPSFPQIPWDIVCDDVGETQTGYFFAADPRNRAWMEPFEGFVLARLLQDSAQRSAWLRHGNGGDYEFNHTAIGRYGRSVNRFREYMLLLFYLTGGQPPRSTELVNLRYRNTRQGGLRNIMIQDGVVYFVTWYHKTMFCTGRAKVIHRFLPREVGTLYMLYILLVLPFWQAVQGTVLQGDAEGASAAMWCEHVLEPARVRHPPACSHSGRTLSGPSPSVPYSERVGFGQGTDVQPAAKRLETRRRRHQYGELFSERVWNTDRHSCLLREASTRYLGCQISVQYWRQLAVAISRKYLIDYSIADDIGSDGSGGEEDDDEFADGVAGLLDRQAAHSSATAGAVYGRTSQDGSLGLVHIKHQLALLSQRWHGLLGLACRTTGRKRKVVLFDMEMQEYKRRRYLELAGRVPLAELRRMLGSEDAQFRGKQERVIGAIRRGDPFVLQVAGTGHGKSLSFMLPAFMAPSGTSIVVVPLVALQSDLLARCEAAGIDAVVWSSNSAASNTSAAIVLVTPESAADPKFANFANRLSSRLQLDRFVVDECHVVLDSTPTFRSGLAGLGTSIGAYGVQIVLLTATLPPADEGPLLDALAVPRARTTVFRSRTTRPNIRYRIHSLEQSRSYTAVDIILHYSNTVVSQFANCKIVVYCRTRSEVEEVAAALHCPAFHSSIGKPEAKLAIVRRWVAEGGIIVATSALGVGVDVPDVRMVIHVGEPTRLVDYVQESGRAGRDGEVAEARIICAERPLRTLVRGAAAAKHDQAMEEFLWGNCCQRVVLDRAMDGYTGRTRCEDDEEPCRRCCGGDMARDKARSQAIVRSMPNASARFDAVLPATREVSDYQTPSLAGSIDSLASIPPLRKASHDLTQECLPPPVRKVPYAQRQAANRAIATARFCHLVQLWGDSCVMCFAAGASRPITTAEHNLCEVHSQDERFADALDSLRAAIVEKKRLARYSGCFHCCLPQAICRSWTRNPDGRYMPNRGKTCQYPRFMLAAIAAIRITDEQMLRRAVQSINRTASPIEGDALYIWLGRKVNFGDLETNNMCLALTAVADQLTP